MSAPSPVHDPETLRARALARMGPYADPRARELLSLATMHIAPDAQAWVSSTGTVHAHDVSLGLPADALGLLHAVPSLRDALTEALSAALAESTHQSLRALHTHWDHRLAPASTGAPYRDSASPTESSGDDAAFHTALLQYLRASIEPELAALIARSTASAARTPSAAEVTVCLPRGTLRGFRRDAHASDALRAACEALLAPEAPVATPPEVRIVVTEAR